MRPDCVFLFSDKQLIKEAMVEHVNNILNSGEVPKHFETKDMERILTKVRLSLSSHNLP